jgi:hypothetical protein
MKNLMNMPMGRKTLGMVAMLVATVISMAPFTALAGNNPTPTVQAQNADEAKAKNLIARLYEIRKQTQSPLSYAEKTKLRNEVISIRKDMKQLHGGIYISCGALIIILLLILIF